MYKSSDAKLTNPTFVKYIAVKEHVKAQHGQYMIKPGNMKFYTYGVKKQALKEQILIIDSEWNILKLLYAVLSANYNLVIKNSSLDAMQWLESGNKPNLIITEYQLPYIDGELLIRHLKCSGLHCDIPVIVLSDVMDLDKKEKTFFSPGAIISKPFNPTYLALKIKALLNEGKSLSA